MLKSDYGFYLIVWILFKSKCEMERERETEKFLLGGLAHSPNSRNPEAYSGGWASVVTDEQLL